MTFKPPYEEFSDRAVQAFREALEEAQNIWPAATRREAFREWGYSMKSLDTLDKRTRAGVLATLLPLVAIGEEIDPETAFRNLELLFVAILESVSTADEKTGKKK